MCELKLKIFLNIPKIYFKCFCDRLRWASSGVQEQNNILHQKFRIYIFHTAITPPRSENHFAIKIYWLLILSPCDLLAVNIMIIWSLVRRFRCLIILTDKQCFWLMSYSRALCKTHTEHPSDICQMLLILSLLHNVCAPYLLIYTH